MTSTPSASALTAVLRCRGNLFACNQGNKKRPPAGSGYSLGLKCGSAAERGAPAVGRDCSVEPRRTVLRWSSFSRERGAAPEGISVQVGRLDVRVPRDAARHGAGLKRSLDISETLSLTLVLHKGYRASGSGAKMGDVACLNAEKRSGAWASLRQRCRGLGSLVSGVLRRRPENSGGERKVHTCDRRTSRRL